MKPRSHARADDKEAISFAVPRELKARLIELAEKDGRTLSNFLLAKIIRQLAELEQEHEKQNKDGQS